MSADYAGACTAIRSRFEQNWLTSGIFRTPIDYVNEPSPESKQDENGNSRQWVFFEIIHNGSTIIGSGTPGQQTIVYDGLIKGHVFVPVGSGVGDGLASALSIGEIFRNRVFFDDVTPGCYVRSAYEKDGQPRIDEGDANSDDGLWFAITASIPFQFWWRG